MGDEYLMMCDDLTRIISNEKDISGNSVMKILKKYSSDISVFDMMDFTSQVIKENRYVQESYREDSQKSYIESFLLRVKDITRDNRDYGEYIDRDAFVDAVDYLRVNHTKESLKSKVPLIFNIASLYATFILRESIHPAGTPFPGSLRVECRDGEFFCPVKDANIDSPNAVCRICLAEQLDF